MTTQKHYVIFVPGIKDDAFLIQSLFIQCWRLYGKRPVMFVMPWSGNGDFEHKLDRLVSKVDTLLQQGHHVSLVGASAGASAVLNVYAKRKNELQSVAYVCGKINRPDSVSNQTYIQNPAFKTSMMQLQVTLSNLTNADKSKLSSFYSPADKTVPYVDTAIEGVAEQELPPLGHPLAIFYSLTLGSRKLMKALVHLSV